MKEGLDYFPLDVVLDTKFELIEAEFGLTGFAVVVKILQYIYGSHGYYGEWNDEVALLFARKIGAGGSAVSEIVSASIRRGIFDREMYDKYEILTSQGIQKRYFEIVKRRVQTNVKNEYLFSTVAKFEKNVAETGKNVAETGKNVAETQQSKIKESKVNKSKGESYNAHTRARFGKYRNVSLSDEEYVKLTDALKEKDRDEYIKRLDVHIESTGKRYKNHYATICKWYDEDHKKKDTKSFDEDEFFNTALKKSYGG